jgi:glycine/D-amino acid oxidase-like deaminating enzyme
MPALADVVVVGAGVFGLWVARRCLQAGLSVEMIDKGGAGHGASGGALGALGPYVPTGWSGKKQFQLTALHGLQNEIEILEAETSNSTGYRRVGRVQPLMTADAVQLAKARVAAGEEKWQLPDGARYQLEICTEQRADYSMCAEPPYGFLTDNLTARLEPAAYCAALFQAATQTNLSFRHSAVRAIDPNQKSVLLEDGSTVSGGRIVIAAGAETFDLLQPITTARLGHGVAGRVIVKRGTVGAGAPIIYTKGCYVVSHASGFTAIGSTTDRDGAVRDDDTAIGELLTAADQMVPTLVEFPVERIWSGVRPNAEKRAPLVGQVSPGIWAATGGFGIGLGLAHQIGTIVADQIQGQPTIDYPANYEPRFHLE